MQKDTLSHCHPRDILNSDDMWGCLTDKDFLADMQERIKLSGVATKCLTFCKRTRFFFCGGGGHSQKKEMGWVK